MNIYTRPLVRLIAKPAMVKGQVDDFLAEIGCPGGWVQEDQRIVDGIDVGPTDGESLPEFAGRICYVSFGEKQGKKTNESYLGNIIAQGHGSVLEHSNYSFLVTRASRGFTHEMVRHRAGFAYSQESTHYIDYTLEKNWSLCVDPRIELTEPDLLSNMQAAAEDAYRSYGRVYNFLRAQGVAKKDACSMARQVLPTGIESKLAFTANVRALRHFIEYRGNAANVLEIREVAVQVLRIMKQEAPNMFDDFQIVPGGDGFDVALSAHRKV